MLRDFRISSKEDLVFWKGGGHGIFGVKDAYNLLVVPNACAFLNKCIWVDKVPTKVAFFAWEATWGKILTLDRFQNGGGSSLIAVFCVVVKRKCKSHSFTLYTGKGPLGDRPWSFWGSMGVPESVKEVLFSWRGPLVGKKRKKIWNFIPLCIFWMIWKERNRLAFRGVL
ncbi:hypothetical protein CK203_027940 [Vitis vinifera]|uniref:Reverse transcriptase zinc-binding domain-containing protein n=1 Tax=Vitis vinifera TaxID=29760 RepID=A0A438J3M9_VITVI|nr:hypothetical protein CK203_027940 [Vitis vinifera]